MRLSLGLAFALLAGCSSLSTPYGSSDGRSDSYIVRSGDTLYAIAFRHGVDVRELAAWNRIANPDRIYVGQRLVLGPPAGSTAAAARSRSAPAARTATASATSAQTPAARAPAAGLETAAMPSWQWPAEGRIVARFGDARALASGVSIAGRLGQDIRAAAAGRVVYTGNGLPDYGQLVIIEHSGSWLSAYGLNQRIVVTQGQTVAGGDKIAEMGTGPGGEPQLHFEIRRNGDPLDPLSLLPDSG